MINMKLRPMTVQDIEPCAAMMVATPLWQRYGVTPASAIERFTAGLTAGETILIADSEDQEHKVLGFIWLVLRGAFNRSGYIQLVGVAPAYRNQGIGHRLLLYAETYFRPHTRDIFLLCTEFNTEAQRFYSRLGYVQVGSLADYILPGIAELVYRKRL